MIFKSKNAFTLAEVTVSLSLIATLAILLYPMLINRVSEEKIVDTTKNAVSDISQAFSAYQGANAVTAATTSADVVSNLTNYTRIINDGSVSIQVDGANSPCNANYPCVVLHNGSFIQYDNDVTPDNFGGLNPNTETLRFLIDPDGSKGPQTATMFALFYTGRIAPWLNAVPPAIENDDLPAYTTDPDYIKDWTDG